MLWDYCKLFKQEREALIDQHDVGRGRRGRWSRRRNGNGPAVLPDTLFNDDGKPTPRCEWGDLFASWWGHYWKEKNT